MPLPPLIRRLADAKLTSFCEARIPAHARDQVRLERRFRANTVTVVERRPAWNGVSAWTRSPIAQLRFDETTSLWTLFCRDRNARWHRYERAAPTDDLDALIDVIDRDETGIFWG